MGEEFDHDNLNKIADAARDSRSLIDEMYSSISRFNKQVTSGAKIGKTLLNNFKGLAKEADNVSKSASTLATRTNAVNKALEKAKEIKAKQLSFERESEVFAKKAQTSSGRIKAEYLAQAQHLSDAAREAGVISQHYSDIAKEAAELDKSTQFFKGASTFMSSIPGLKAFAGPFQEAEKSAKQALLDGKTSQEAMQIGFSKMGPMIGKMFGLFLLKSLFTANDQIVEMQRNINISEKSAYKFRNNLSLAAANANNLRVTSEGMMKTNAALNEQLGYALQYDTDRLVVLTEILDAQVMSNEAAAQLSILSNNAGMSIDDALKSQEAAVNSVNQEYGARISLQGVLEASSKVSGQIKAQLGANPEAIARAVTQAKALGFELEQIANSGKQLLNFESSIEAELKAELLTGKQLNLEKARMAALTGDYETLTSEIANNVGDWSDFSKMNVLQQEALAESVGMTADELSNTLLKQGDIAAMMQEAKDTGDEQTLQQLTAISNSEKFAKSLEKVKTMFVDVMAVISPITHAVGFIADMFGSIPGMIGLGIVGLVKMIPILKALRASSMVSAVANIFASAFKMHPLAGIALSAAALGSLYAATKKAVTMDDGTISSKGMTVNHPKGTIQLNKDDSIIAGTNLGGGGGNNASIDYNKMANAMSNVQVKSETSFSRWKHKSPMSVNGDYNSNVTSFTNMT